MNKSSIKKTFIKQHRSTYLLTGTIFCLVMAIFSWLFLNRNEDTHKEMIDLEQAKWLAFDKKSQITADSIAEKNLAFHTQQIDIKNALKATSLTINTIGIDTIAHKEIKTSLAKGVKKIRLTITLGNTNAKKGNHEIYIRILDSKHKLLGLQKGSFFVLDDHLQYTAKATINFLGKPKTYNIVWQNPKHFAKDTYDVSLYADGHLMIRRPVTLQ